LRNLHNFSARSAHLAPYRSSMRNHHYALGATIALGTTAVLVLGAGALGIIGDGGRADLVYVAVLAVGLIGTVLSRLRAEGMAMTLAAMALAQLLVTGIAILAGLAEDASVLDLLGLTAMFAGGFGIAAWLFDRAAGQAARESISR
jgi:hypothetical protein